MFIDIKKIYEESLVMKGINIWLERKEDCLVEDRRMMFYNSSQIFDESFSRNDPLFWNRSSPIDCGIVRTVGIILCISSVIGMTLNGSLLYSFIWYKILRTPPNIFLMFISLMGLIGSLGTLPLTGLSSVYCRWLFNRIGCQIEGIAAFLYGCSSSYLLCAVSLTRSYIIIKPFNAKDITVIEQIVIEICVFFSRFV